jgi:hypothetical protein
MQDIVVKYLNGLPDGASRFQRRMYKKYGGVTNVSKTIEYDLKHGATKNDIISFLVTLKTEDSSLPKVLITLKRLVGRVIKNYLESMPCFTSPLILLSTSAIPIPIFLAIIAAVFREFSLMAPLLSFAN